MRARKGARWDRRGGRIVVLSSCRMPCGVDMSMRRRLPRWARRRGNEEATKKRKCGWMPSGLAQGGIEKRVVAVAVTVFR